MRAFVAFVLTCAVLGVALIFAIRSYDANLLNRFTAPPEVTVTIVVPAEPDQAQQNEANVIAAKLQEVPSAKVQMVAARDLSLPSTYRPFMWAMEILAAFAILTPIFILYSLINWMLKVVE